MLYMLYFYKTAVTKIPKNYKISVNADKIIVIVISSSSRILNTLMSKKGHVSNKCPSVRDKFLINAPFI